MGYYTNFTMKVLDESMVEVDSSVYPEFAEESLYDGYFSVQDLISNDADNCKWYDHEEDVREYSKKFPNLVFILDGEGEEPGDIWREFYKNGKSYRWDLEHTLPEFEEGKLE